MGGDRVERATARRLAHLIKSSNPKAPAVKPRGRGGCPGGGGLEGRGRSRAGGLRSADRRGGTGRGGLAGALPLTSEADRRGRSVPDRRQSERPQSAEDTPARDGQSAIAGAAAQPAVRCSYRNATRQSPPVGKCLAGIPKKPAPGEVTMKRYCGRRRAAARMRIRCTGPGKISDGVVKIGMLKDMSSMPGRLSRAGAPLSEVIGPPLNYT
jgi:hypothetical protein